MRLETKQEEKRHHGKPKSDAILANINGRPIVVAATRKEGRLYIQDAETLEVLSHISAPTDTGRPLMAVTSSGKLVCVTGPTILKYTMQVYDLSDPKNPTYIAGYTGDDLADLGNIVATEGDGFIPIGTPANLNY